MRRKSGRFDLLGVLGHGGSCKVLLAREGEDPEIALKVLERGCADYGEHLSSLRNEEVYAPLADHPRVVRILFFEEDEEGARLGMEWMRGGTLHDMISRQGRIDEATALRILMQVHKGLSAAHARGIIHRDLKPANILLNEKGSAKLGDFGLARSLGVEPEASAELLATPDYVAPEVIAGFPGDVTSDLYGLGGCLYHALFGCPPYETEGLFMPDLKKLKATKASIPSGECSRGTKRLLEHLLDPDPSRRLSSDADLAGHLLTLLEGFPRSEA